jgi:hypothetical protein
VSQLSEVPLKTTMTIAYRKMAPFGLGAALFGLIFSVLFAARTDVFHLNSQTRHGLQPISEALTERSTWMAILQNHRRIGYAHTTLNRTEGGYALNQQMALRVNTMGLVHDVTVHSRGRLNPDLSVSGFHFSLSSGRFHFSARGSVSGKQLSVLVGSGADRRSLNIALKKPLFLAAGLFDAVWAADLSAGESVFMDLFDPATMDYETVRITMIGSENVTTDGRTSAAKKISVDYKGMTQHAWIDAASGETIKQTGLLGLTLIKTSRRDALAAMASAGSSDLTRDVSVASNRRLERPADLPRLRYRIAGFDLDAVALNGGRQHLVGDILTIEKEQLDQLPDRLDPLQLESLDPTLMAPTAFIQSDHPQIRDVVAQIVAKETAPVEIITRLVAWMRINIKQRPVVSMPDAVATLTHRVGDCNEHAVLLAAMARAAGIPADIEAGLVYLDGRFFYHAWNRVFVGRWITVDALFGQVPADVTHIRLASGNPSRQLDLIAVIGRIQLTILADDPELTGGREREDD